jgi:hypothetical protein
MPALLLVLATVGGCGWFQDEAENRALGFIETLVVDPANTTRLSEQANTGHDPQALVRDLPPQLASGYLRSRQAQGAALRFVASRVERPDNRHRTVTVLVRADGPAGSSSDEVAFAVALERDNGTWRIARVRGGR